MECLTCQCTEYKIMDGDICVRATEFENASHCSIMYVLASKSYSMVARGIITLFGLFMCNSFCRSNPTAWAFAERSNSLVARLSYAKRQQTLIEWVCHFGLPVKTSTSRPVPFSFGFDKYRSMRLPNIGRTGLRVIFSCLSIGPQLASRRTSSSVRNHRPVHLSFILHLGQNKVVPASCKLAVTITA